MRLLHLLIHDNDYSNAKHILNEVFKSKQQYVLDANIIIVLARERDEEKLNRLLFDSNFRIYDLTLYEINGLLKAKEFDKETSKILNQFLNETNKSKIIKVPNYKIHRLYELAELLPRKIVHEAMITMKDSWIQKIIEKYNELLDNLKIPSTGDIKNEMIKFNKMHFNNIFIIKKYVENLFLETTSKLGIDESKLDEKKYFEFCQKQINSVKSEVDKILMRNISSHLNVNDKLLNIITELKAYARKSYKQDIRFVIHSVESAINGYSLDSDIIWLYEFDYYF